MCDVVKTSSSFRRRLNFSRFSFLYFCVLLTASKSRYFVWTKEHDILMLREALTSEPYNFKPKSSERGQVWESIAAHLNSLKRPEFSVTSRAVRD